MRAEVALLGGVGVRVYVQSVVRTRLHAGLATDAPVSIEVDDAVVAAKESCHRTDRYARSVFAVIASEHRKEAASVGEFALFDVLNPRSKSAEWYFVFRLARYSAGVAADTLSMVYDKPVFHLESLPQASP